MTEKEKKKVTKAQKDRRSIFRKRTAGPSVHEAALRGDLVELQKITHGKEKAINQTNEELETPLHLAVTNGHEEIVRYLLDHKADPYLVDKRGWTVLHCAVFNNHEAITLMLLEKNQLDVTVQNDDANTALHYFARNPVTSRTRLLTL